MHLLTLSKTKVSVNIFILLFYICPPQVHPGIQIHPICDSFMNTGYKFFYILHRFNILRRQLIRISIRHFEYSSSNLVTT